MSRLRTGYLNQKNVSKGRNQFKTRNSNTNYTEFSFMNDDFNVRLVVLAALWFAICTLVPIVLILPLILILL